MSKHERYVQSKEIAETANDDIAKRVKAGEFAAGVVFENSGIEQPQSHLPSIKGRTPDRVTARMKDLN